MLPEYQNPGLSMARLTDDVMSCALERCEFSRISVLAAREAVYTYMSHSTVWDHQLAQFQQYEFPNLDLEENSAELLASVEALSQECGRLICMNEVIAYRDAHVHILDVVCAMHAIHVCAEATTMQNLVAAYVVMGPDGLVNDYDTKTEMEVTGCTLETVQAVYEYIKNN